MWRHILLPALLCLFITGNAADTVLPAGGKSAILMVHFGTTHDDTRLRTIEAVNRMAADSFPDMKIVEAYTSRTVIRRLRERGIERATPQEALLRLAADGYTHVFVQGTNVIDGVESEVLAREVDYMRPFFKDIRIGRPLLYSVGDCSRVTDLLVERHGACATGDRAVVMVGHGTEGPATAVYSQIDHMFAAGGNPCFHVGTVEGYPAYGEVLARLRSQGAKEVVLVPFMFVAGDHARNDIAVKWLGMLEREGFRVTAVDEGLGEIPGIRDIYMDHIRDGLREKPVTAVERKRAFLETAP